MLSLSSLRPMRYRPNDVLVVIPAFNEELSVGRVVREVHEKVPGATCLVVNDGSRDDTAESARTAGAAVLSLPFNLGVGGAMRAGFAYALKHHYSVVIQVDADGQHNPEGIPALLERLENADVVLGARFAGAGEYTVRGPRRWAMVVLGSVLSKTCGVRLTDTTSGFRASGPRAVALFAEHYPAEYLGDTIESLVIAARSGLVIDQIPVAMRARTTGQPSQNPGRAAVYLARAVVALSFALVRPAVPARKAAA